MLWDNSIFLGEAKRGKEKCMQPEDREAHLHVIGGSRKGKSKFLEHMIRKDILNNNPDDDTTGGICVVDPHGFLYDDLVNWCTEKRIFDDKKIVLFNPLDDNWTFGFNPFHTNSHYPSFLSDYMITLFEKVWGDEDSNKMARFKRIATAVFRILIEKNLSLLEAQYLASTTEKTIRNYLTKDINDKIVSREWKRLNNYSDIVFEEKVESSVNRIIEFLSDPIIRNTIGQTEDTINFREIMDEGHILLVNLSSLDRISPKKSQLLGAMIVNDILQVSKGRKKNSKPFYFYIDECADYLTSDISTILTQGSKFGLRLILAHHNLAQLRNAGDEVYSAVMAIQNKIVFGGINVEDAEFLAKDIFINAINLQEPKKILNKHTLVGYKRELMVGGSKIRSHTDIQTTATSSGLSEILTQVTNEMSGELASSSIASGDSSSTANMYGASDAESEARSWSEALVPILNIMPTQVYSLEEQIFKAIAKLVSQSRQHAIIKLADSMPSFVKTPTVEDGCASDEMVQEAVTNCYEHQYFARPTKEVEAGINDRCIKLEQQAAGVYVPVDDLDEEIPTYRRKRKKTTS